jgi:hypothetical protein
MGRHSRGVEVKLGVDPAQQLHLSSAGLAGAEVLLDPLALPRIRGAVDPPRGQSHALFMSSSLA